MLTAFSVFSYFLYIEKTGIRDIPIFLIYVPKHRGGGSNVCPINVLSKHIKTVIFFSNGIFVFFYCLKIPCILLHWHVFVMF